MSPERTRWAARLSAVNIWKACSVFAGGKVASLWLWRGKGNLKGMDSWLKKRSSQRCYVAVFHVRTWIGRAVTKAATWHQVGNRYTNGNRPSRVRARLGIFIFCLCWFPRMTDRGYGCRWYSIVIQSPIHCLTERLGCCQIVSGFGLCSYRYVTVIHTYSESPYGLFSSRVLDGPGRAPSTVGLVWQVCRLRVATLRSDMIR